MKGRKLLKFWLRFVLYYSFMNVDIHGLQSEAINPTPYVSCNL